MSTVDKKTYFLSIIVPIATSLDKLSPLSTWVRSFQNNPEVQIILVQDLQQNTDYLDLSELTENALNVEDFRVSFRNPGETRNFGLKVASGKWIVFCDSDDEPDVNELINMVHVAQIEDVDIIVGEYVSYETDTQLEIHHCFGNSSSTNLMKFAVNPGIWRVAFKKSLLNETEFPALKMGEDQVFLAKILKQSDSISFYLKPVYKYYKNNQLQLTNTAAAILDIRDSLTRTLNLYKEESSSTANIFTTGLIIRQSLTGLKRDNLINKAQYSSYLVKIFLMKPILSIQYAGIIFSRYIR